MNWSAPEVKSQYYRLDPRRIFNKSVTARGVGVQTEDEAVVLSVGKGRIDRGAAVAANLTGAHGQCCGSSAGDSRMGEAS
jgi:hypothetical protein